MAEDIPTRGDSRPRPAKSASAGQWCRHGLGDHRHDDLRDGRMGRGRVVARPLAWTRVFFPRSASSSAWRWRSTWWSPGTAPSTRLRGDGPARPRADDGAGPGRTDRRRRDNGDPQRPRARQRARRRPGLPSPRPRGVLPQAALDLHAARHRLRDHPDHADPLDRDAGDDRASSSPRSASRRSSRASCSSSARAATRWSATASPATSSARGASRSRRSSPRCSSSSWRTT